ncbi:RDD family protein [soil metagenome]
MDNTITQSNVAPPAESTTAATSYRYAGFWIRVVAGLIDGVLLAAVGYIIKQILGESDAIAVVIGAGYYIGMWIKNDGMTIGKKLMGIKVIQTNGQPIDIKTGVLRYIGYVVSAMVLFIGFIWVAFDKNKQGWHDKIASTFVVYK